MTRNALLLSIRPEYANKIFDGTKTVELRRTRPRLEVGDRVLVYVSTPVKALMGMFEVGRVMDAPPSHLWSHVREHAGITRWQFDHYYTGADRAYGIFLKSPRQLPIPIKLGHLRELIDGFVPPQSYRYLTHDEVRLVSPESQRFKKIELLPQMSRQHSPISPMSFP